MLNHFKNRRNFLEFVDTTTRTWMLTAEGARLDSSSLIETTMINEITPELAAEWKRGKMLIIDVLM